MKTLHIHELQQVSGGKNIINEFATSAAFAYVGEASVKTLFANTAAYAAHSTVLPLAGWIIGWGVGNVMYNVCSNLYQ